MSIVIVDYHVGNIGSIQNMLKRIGVVSVVSSDKEIILKSTKLILPGVGAFDAGMSKLGELKLIDVLKEKAYHQKTPILGICLGMQILTKGSEEGSCDGLGIVNARTIKFEKNNLKVPHMGWNLIKPEIENKLLEGLDNNSRFYFVHSYHTVCEEKENILATTFYGDTFVSALANDNVFGVQFHPEKSHKFGMKLLKNFCEM